MKKKYLSVFLVVLIISISLFAQGSGEVSIKEQDRSIKLVIAEEIISADPNDMERGDALVFKGNVCQTLTDINPTTSVVEPLLATSWEPVDDNTWLFHLREGVTFHDGEPFNAEAALFSINRALNSTEITNTDKAKVAEIITPYIVDAKTIKLVTNVPAPNLPREMAFVHMSSPKSTPQKAKTDVPIGTGPYKFVEWVRGQHIIVERWDGYWGKLPQVEKATLVFREEPSVRAQMVTTGEADLAVPITQENATDDDRTKAFSTSSVFFMRIPIYVAPFNDIRVRQAVQYAIDKKAISEFILGRTGVATDNCVADSVNGFIPGYVGPEYNPEKAKQLLAEAKADGVPVDKAINFIGQVNQFTYSEEALQYVTQNLQDVGLNVKLSIVDPARWAEILFHEYDVNKENPTILAVKNRNPTGDSSITLTSYVDPNGCCSESKDADLAALIDKARRTIDPQQRTSLFRDAHMYLYTKDISIVPVAELRALMIISDRIEYTPNSQSFGMQLKLSEISFNK